MQTLAQFDWLINSIETAISIAAADGFDHVTREAWKTAMRAIGRRERRVVMGFV